MRTKRIGFTLVEIALFLAITALLFVGIMAGTGTSIAQQRYTDTVQNFTELLRSVYSEVSNPQSVSDGRSNLAIYGKLISFGQKTGLDGKPLADQLEQRIFIYDVVGSVDAGGGNLEEVLGALGLNVAVVTEWKNGKIEKMGPAGEIKSYIPRWGASIENVDHNTLFNGSILVVRHPKSGTINTLVWGDGVIDVNAILNEANEKKKFGNEDPVNTMLTSKLSKFKTSEIDFCINPSGVGVKNNNRRDIRLVKNARNASGVELIDLDLDLKDLEGKQIGNRCRFD
jgi:hypothetical protein